MMNHVNANHGLVLLLVVAALAGLSACDSAGDQLELEIGTLEIEDVVIGDGESAALGDSVFVRYVGTLENGDVFDAFQDSAGLGFILSADRLIEGWADGVPGMREGGRRILTIPPNLAYGLGGVPQAGIPPNATLIFDIEMVRVVKLN